MNKHHNQTTVSPTSNTQGVDTWTNIRTRLQPAQPAIHNTWTHEQTSEPDYSQPNQQYTTRGHMNKHQNQTTASPTSNTQHVDTWTNIRTRLQPAQPAIHNTWTHEQTSQPDYSQPNQQYTRRGHMNKHQNQTTASPTSNTQGVDTWTNITTRLQPAQPAIQPAQPAIHKAWTHEQTSQPEYSQPNQQYTTRGHMNKHQNQTTASSTSNTQHVDTWTNIRTRLQPAQPAIHNTWTHEQTSEPDYSQLNQQYTRRGHMNKHQNQTTASPTSNTQHVDTWTNIRTRLQPAQPAIHNTWTHKQTSEPDYSQPNQQYTTRGHMNKHQNQTTASPTSNTQARGHMNKHHNQTTASPTSNTQHVDTWTNIRTRLQPAQPAIHKAWTHEQTSEPDYSQPNQQYTRRGHMNKHQNQTTASPTSNTQGVDTWTNIRTRLQPAQPAIHKAWTHEQTSEPDYSQPNQQYTRRGHMNKHQNQTTASPTSNTQGVDTWTNIRTRLQPAQPAIHKPAWTHEQTSQPDYSQPNQYTSNTQEPDVDTWTNITTRLQPAQPIHKHTWTNIRTRLAIHKWTHEQTSEPDYSQLNQQYTTRGHMNKHQNQTTASPTSNTQHVDTWTNIRTRLQPAQPAIHNAWTHVNQTTYTTRGTNIRTRLQPANINQQYTRRGHMNKHQNQTTASPTSNTQHVDTWTNIRTRLQPAQPAIHNTWTHEQTSEPDYSQPNQQYTTRGHMNKHHNQTTASPTSNTQGVDTWTNIRTRLQPAQPAIHNTWTQTQPNQQYTTVDTCTNIRTRHSQLNQQYTTRGHMNKHQNQTTASPTSNTQGVDTWTNIRTRLQPAQPAIHKRGHMNKHQTRLQPAQPAIHKAWTHEQTSQPDYSQPNQQYTSVDTWTNIKPDYSQPNQQYTRRGHMNKHEQDTASPTSNDTNIRTRLQPAQPAIHNTWTHEQTSQPDYSQLNHTCQTTYTTRGHMNKHQNQTTASPTSNTQTNIRTWTHEQTSEPDYSQPNQQYTTRGHMNKHQNQTTASPTSNTQRVDTWTNIRTRLQPAQPAIHNTWTHEQTSEPDYSQPNQQYTTRGHMNKHQNQTTASPTSNTQHVDTWTNIRTRLQPAQPAIHNTWTHEQTSQPDYSQPNQQYTTTRLQPAQPAIHNTWTHEQTSEPDYSQPNQQYTTRGHMNKHQNQTTASPTSNTQGVDTWTNIRTRLQPAQPAIHNTWTHEQTSEPDYSQLNQQYTTRGHMKKHQEPVSCNGVSHTYERSAGLC